ncbi:MAG: glycosyltransferase [Methanolinea sp.]|nr:glycosyltransferase [Methanolinea sp.]
MVKVSVVIPSYNNARFLPECIESALNQTFSDIELIIVDDGSCDNSMDIIRKYASKDPRIRVIIHDKNYGVSKTTNDGILASLGEFITLLASDDVMLPTRIEELYNEILKNPDYGLVHSDIYVIDEKGVIQGKIIGKEKYSKGWICGEVLWRRGCHIGYPLFRKSVLFEVGLYDESLRGGEDYDLYTRITQNYPIGYVQKPLILYRRHSSNASRNLRLMVNDYKHYLDKTFKNDSCNIYWKIKPFAYSHYYVDLLYCIFMEGKKHYILKLIKKIFHFIIRNPTTIINNIIPFFTILFLRIEKIVKKKITKIVFRQYIQVGW